MGARGGVSGWAGGQWGGGGGELGWCVHVCDSVLIGYPFLLAVCSISEGIHGETEDAWFQCEWLVTRN